MDKRRCRPGYTHEPYECCGTEGGPYGRPKGVICKDCADLIAEGKAARAEKAALGAEVRQWTERSYAWPRYYGSGAEIPAAQQEALVEAFFALVNAVTTPAPGDTPSVSPRTETRRGWNGKPEVHQLPWDKILSDPGQGYDSWSFSKLVLVRPEVQAALDALHVAIKQALGATFERGKVRGSSILNGLVSGELTLNAFDAELQTADQRRQRGR